MKPSRSSHGGVENGMVLRRRGDDVVPLFAIGAGGTEDGEVVALGRAAREDDLAGLRVHPGGDLAAGFIDRRFRLPAEDVAPRSRVPEGAREVRQHRLEYPCVDRVVE